MHLITLRDKIKMVPENWKRQYKYTNVSGWRTTLNGDSEKIYKELAALNLETCSKEEVDKIIGNDSWCQLKCDECSKNNLTKVIVVGEPQDYESRTATLCRDCIMKVYELIV